MNKSRHQQDQLPLSPLDALEQKHARDNAARKDATDAAMRELREAESLVRESTEKVRRLQQENINASFAYDAERDRLLAEAEAATKKAA